RFPWIARPRGSARGSREGRRSTPRPWSRSPLRTRRVSPASCPLLLLLLLLLRLLGLRRAHESLRQHALEDDLHVHRIVLQQRRRRDNRQILVVVEHPFGKELEPQVAFLDRRVTQLVPSGVLDSREERVGVS